MYRVKKLISFLISVILLGVFTLSVFANSGQSPLDYAPPGSLMSLDQKDGTVKKVKQNITGKIKKKDAAQKVTYEVYAAADNGGLTAAGEAQLKDGSFTVSGLRLKPDNNRIAVTVHTAGGKTETQTINIHYNAGSIKDVPMKDVAKIRGGEMKYVTNNLLVFFDEGTDDARRQAIIDTVGGKFVGFIDGINMWQVEVKRGTDEQLRKIAEKLKGIEGVFDAQLNMAQAAKTMAVPNDPWYSNGSPAWSELKPRGGNWSVEAIQALSAWDYQYFYKNIKVGIVDAGVQNDHEDLTGKVFFPDAQSQTDNDPTDNHGTHVAGIMGATPNNGLGVTGILWNTTMYAYNWDTLAGTDAHLMEGLTKTVQAGAKVVNFSLGLADDISYLGPPETNQKVKDYAQLSKNYMYPLLQAGNDFIVVQSAGNGQGGYSQDAIYNGYFCSVTYNNLTDISAEMVQKINERIIVVGSAMYNSDLNYMQAASSNAGSQVDICAPGVDVFSCYAGNSYYYMSGTSMAAPVTAGVAALTWSVNPTLTGAQVRDIVLTNTNPAFPVKDNPSSYHPLVNTYQMVNAKLAAEAAIATIPPDYAAVHTAVAAANALNADLFTPASWAVLMNAVSAVDYNRPSIEQVQINAYAENINTAIANLVYKTVDYTVEYRLNSETGDRIAADKTGTGQVTKTVTETAPVIGGYAPVTAVKQLTLELTGNKIIFIYITQPAYGAVLNTYKNIDGQLIPVTSAAAGDTITVTVTPATNFYCAGSKFVVMYDKNFYTLLGNNSSAFTANTANNYYMNTVTSFNGTVSHPPESWPATFTGGENALYNYITTAYYAGPGSANGGFPTRMNDGQWLFSFKLRVNTNATGSGRIFMDHRWTKTNTNITGLQYFQVCANETVPNTAGNNTMNLLPDLAQADRSIAIATPATVSFNLNGGAGTLPEPQVGIPGMPFVLPAQGEFTREHYTFAGWAVTPDAGEPLTSFSYPESDMALYAVWQSVPAVLNCDAEPAIFDENGFVVGIAPGTAKSSFTVSGNYRLEFSTAGTTVGTGTVITIVNNATSQITNTLTVVIFGDVNGDGLIDSLDAGLAVDHENYLVPWSNPADFCFRTAADANGDGSRDSIDAGLMVDAENYIETINQNRGISPG